MSSTSCKPQFSSILLKGAGEERLQGQGHAEQAAQDRGREHPDAWRGGFKSVSDLWIFGMPLGVSQWILAGVMPATSESRIESASTRNNILKDQLTPVEVAGMQGGMSP